jgi:GT2 family glycosyltransferase/SAM-dependent methyltransferase
VGAVTQSADPTDLVVIIPTRGRDPILAQTLDALSRQTVCGFSVCVVVDGEDQEPSSIEADLVLVQPQAGPGAARNRGLAATNRPLVLFLGDDITPCSSLIETHLAAHTRESEPAVAVIGRSVWHPDAGASWANTWLDRTSSQFDFAGITDRRDAGWGRFYSSNVSLRRALLLAAGGFDEDFAYDYEDLDLAWRLHGLGMRLVFEPGALATHNHAYDGAALARRFRAHGVGERMMAEKHAWFEPFFAGRIRVAEKRPPVNALWPLVQRAAARIGRDIAGGHVDALVHQRLSGPFDGGWVSAPDIQELRQYLGLGFDDTVLAAHRDAVEREEADAIDEATFYRSSDAYLYDLTMFATWGTKAPYRAALRRLLPPGALLLDYGCGIGTDGLRLIEDGYRVNFADFDNPSVAYLRWRLERRGFTAEIFDIEKDVWGSYDAAYSFDVIEHVADPMGFLSQLEKRAGLVVVNLLEADPSDTHLHKPLPVAAIIRHAMRRGLRYMHKYEGRSWLIAYRGDAGQPIGTVSSLAAAGSGMSDLIADRLVECWRPGMLPPG